MSELHCWVDEVDYTAKRYGLDSDECVDAQVRGGGTCMLPDGHGGEHVFTPDNDIVVSFNPASAGEGRKERGLV